jgi:hypothetical protein
MVAVRDGGEENKEAAELSPRNGIECGEAERLPGGSRLGELLGRVGPWVSVSLHVSCVVGRLNCMGRISNTSDP